MNDFEARAQIKLEIELIKEELKLDPNNPELIKQLQELTELLNQKDRDLTNETD